MIPCPVTCLGSSSLPFRALLLCLGEIFYTSRHLAFSRSLRVAVPLLPVVYPLTIIFPEPAHARLSSQRVFYPLPVPGPTFLSSRGPGFVFPHNPPAGPALLSAKRTHLFFPFHPPLFLLVPVSRDISYLRTCVVYFYLSMRA